MVVRKYLCIQTFTQPPEQAVEPSMSVNRNMKVSTGTA
jgi:hypothetical protein